MILRAPADGLCETNRIVEQSAWGRYRKEFKATYDYKPARGCRTAAP